MFRLTWPYLTFTAYNPSYFISFFSTSTVLEHLHAQYIQCKKKLKKIWSPFPNLFHRVTGNPKHTIICLSFVCMYLLPHVCMENMFDLLYLMLEKILDSLLTDIKKSHAPLPPSLIKLLVSNKENKWVWRHVTALGHINEYSDS